MRILLGLISAFIACVVISAQNHSPAGSCKAVGRTQFLSAVPEASGIAVAAGALWTHNDSDAPVLFRVDSGGGVTPVAVAGAEVRDWEDVASATCPASAKGTTGETCLYIADIGDNRGSRQRITIYQVPVPAPGTTSTKTAEAYHATYPDHPHDAEALLFAKPGTFIITKEVPARVYQFGTSLKPGETSALTFVRALSEKVRITGAAASPDGRWVALRSNTTLLLYKVDDFVKGENPVRVDLQAFKEPQGEGVAFGRGGELFLVSEGGGSNAAGTLTAIHCAFIQ
jgi:hypothetical protein